MSRLNRFSAAEFARRLRDTTPDSAADTRSSGRTAKQSKRFAFFLGAGCSVTSGIPTAARLVRDAEAPTDWLRRLRDVRSPDVGDQEVDSWARTVLTRWDPNNPGAAYGELIEELFPEASHRQLEIERICDGVEPGLGYAILSGLMLAYHDAFNVVLTTNFDDLLFDAFFLYRHKRPFVIDHESLAPFIRPTESRPLIVKLHGDNRLSPKNTIEETIALNELVADRVATVLHDRAVVFIGYGGNDISILEMFRQLPSEALPGGVYWVSRDRPSGIFGAWLERRNATWIQHDDFDSFLLLLQAYLDIDHPSGVHLERRVNEYFGGYWLTIRKLLTQLESLGEAQAFRKRLQITPQKWRDHQNLLADAERAETIDPREAESLYLRGLKLYPSSEELLSAYANFLHNSNRSPREVEHFYLSAIAINPDNANALLNYALFLSRRRDGSQRRALSYFDEAVKKDPTNPIALAAYADYLSEHRGEFALAESYFNRALQLHKRNVRNTLLFAEFLWQKRGDLERAQEMFSRALGQAPNDPIVHVTYATFLASAKDNAKEAEEHFATAVTLEQDTASALALHAHARFLHYCKRDLLSALKQYRKAIQIDRTNIEVIRDYVGCVLQNSSDDIEEADNAYNQALWADENAVDVMAEYAYFLHHVKGDVGLAWIPIAAIHLRKSHKKEGILGGFR